MHETEEPEAVVQRSRGDASLFAGSGGALRRCRVVARDEGGDDATEVGQGLARSASCRGGVDRRQCVGVGDRTRALDQDGDVTGHDLAGGQHCSEPGEGGGQGAALLDGATGGMTRRGRGDRELVLEVDLRKVGP